MNLKNRRVLITGASRGIGRALAIEVASRGARVALVARDADRLHALANELEGTAHPADLADPEVPQPLFQRVENEAGQVDVVVNNAGIMGAGDICDLEDELIERFYRVNVLAPLYIMRAALREFRARKDGHIVNISSVAGSVAVPNSAIYSSTKAALTRLHRGVEVDSRDSGVSFTLVEPGYVDTELLQQFPTDLGPKPASPKGYSRQSRIPALTTVIPAEVLAKGIADAIERNKRTVRLPRRMGAAPLLGDLPTQLMWPLMKRSPVEPESSD